MSKNEKFGLMLFIVGSIGIFQVDENSALFGLNMVIQLAGSCIFYLSKPNKEE